MSFKIIELKELGTVKLYKRRNSRSLRININQDGQVSLSLPHWVPYATGHKFLLSKMDWVEQKRTQVSTKLSHGMRIGKAHQMAFAACAAPQIQTKIIRNTVSVEYPQHLQETTDAVQTAAKTAATRALRKEAEQLLPRRLAVLSNQTGLGFKNLKFKILKRRWGSCSADGQITLNIFLLQLPWHLIDYVILHELTHTKVLSHGAAFWRELGRYEPSFNQLRKEIRRYQPSLIQSLSMA